MTDSELYVGLISGTSADGIDAVLMDFSSSLPQLIENHFRPYTNEEQSAIRRLMLPGDNEIDQLGVIDHQLGHAFAQTVLALLKKAGVKASQIAAIGSHGQTLRHRPEGQLEAPFTLQICDPNVIAEQTGITTVADFRRRDMAAGGQGAPLAPAIHNSVFRSETVTRFIVNIGGIGNITHLPIVGDAIGFDTGPGNCLMDDWISLHQQKTYDANGQWASQGNVDQELLAALLKHPYLEKAVPKSTGREEFHLPWLQSVLENHKHVNAVDVQASLAEFTAISITNDILKVVRNAEPFEVYICGGGAHSSYLMQRLAKHLSPSAVSTTADLGIPPDWVEAAAFAWMAKQTLERKPGNLASVTGAKKSVILGGVYYV